MLELGLPTNSTTVLVSLPVSLRCCLVVFPTRYAKMITKERTVSILTKAVGEYTYKPNNSAPSTGEESTDVVMEILSREGTFDNMDLSDYPDFLNTFASHQDYMPQVVLLREMLGNTLDVGTVELNYNTIMDTILETFVSMIGIMKTHFCTAPRLIV